MKRFLIVCLSIIVSLSIFSQNADNRSQTPQFPSWMPGQTWPQQQSQVWQQNEQQSRQIRQTRQFSPTDYRNRQKEFISSHAGLTNEESEKFFPLYYELQEKKRNLNREARQLAVHPQGRHFTEEEYTKIIDNRADMGVKIAQLEKYYIEKYKKVIPASKILKVQIAEEQFNSELLKDMQHQRLWYSGNNWQNFQPQGQSRQGQQNQPEKNTPAPLWQRQNKEQEQEQGQSQSQGQSQNRTNNSER